MSKAGRTPKLTDNWYNDMVEQIMTLPEIGVSQDLVDAMLQYLATVRPLIQHQEFLTYKQADAHPALGQIVEFVLNGTAQITAALSVLTKLTPEQLQ